MNKRIFHRLRGGAAALAVLMALLLSACNSEAEHISESTMEDLLYDLHLAQAMVQQMPTDSINYYGALYKQSILNKYGITADELKQSLLYYSANSQVLAKIYNRLAERTKDADVMSAGDVLAFQADGDTLNLWNGPSCLLFANTGRNSYSCTLELDTLVQPGDRLQWRSFSSAVYSEGERNAYVTATLTYADTVAHAVYQIGGYGLQTFDVPTHDTRKLQKLCLTILQNAPWSADIKLLSISNIYLLRIRPPKAVETPATEAAGETSESIPDSVSSATGVAGDSQGSVPGNPDLDDSSVRPTAGTRKPSDASSANPTILR